MAKLWQRFFSVSLTVGVVSFATLHAYEIGQQQTNFVDPARSRTVGVTIYYPADTPGDSVPVASGAFPVISFGHGFLIGISSYGFLVTGLVPEGYILVLPTTEGTISPDHLDFGRDLAFLCDHFQTLNSDPASLFFGHVSPDSAIAGHSMGGGAGFLGVSYASGVSTLVTLAAAETDPSAVTAAASIQVPSLLFSGTEDCVTPPGSHQIPMYNALASACKSHVTITGGSHCQFAQNNSTCRLGEIFSGCSADITQAQQESLTIQYLLPWFGRFLKNDSAAWTEFENLLNSGAQSGAITFSMDCDIVPTPTPTAECSNDGDADLNGTLTAADAQLIFNIVLGIVTPSFEQACAADCDGSGAITAGDAQQTFNAVLGTGECVEPLTRQDILIGTAC